MTTSATVQSLAGERGNAPDAVAELSRRTGVPMRFDDGVLTVRGAAVDLPQNLVGEKADLFGIGGMMPNVPRADVRERLLWWAIKDTRPDTLPEAEMDAVLLEQLPDLMPGGDADAREALAEALRERYTAGTKAPFLLPVQTDLAYGYDHTRHSRTGDRKRYTNYRMFSGALLLFLTWDGTGPDVQLLERLFEALNSEDGMTRVDRLMLKAARDVSGVSGAAAAAEDLVTEHRTRVAEALAAGAFCQPQLDRFRRDLATLLDTGLPRTDLTRAVTILISLHTCVLLYRIAVVQGGRLDAAVAAAWELDTPAGLTTCACDRGLEGCTLAGRMRFRVGTAGFRPVSRRDPCHTSWLDVDRDHLLAMPATLITANLATRVWYALGGPPQAGRPDLDALAAALDSDGALRHDLNAGCAALAAVHHNAHWGQTARAAKVPAPTLDELLQAAAAEPGLHALREDVRRSRRKDLRHQSRDIANQLMLHASGGILSRNGPVTYFEADEEVLTLLVRLICRDEQIEFGGFIAGLGAYGLAPQDETERDRLADALQRLGLMVRYSDAGEAAYVHYDV